MRNSKQDGVTVELHLKPEHYYILLGISIARQDSMEVTINKVLKEAIRKSEGICDRARKL